MIKLGRSDAARPSRRCAALTASPTTRAGSSRLIHYFLFLSSRSRICCSSTRHCSCASFKYFYFFRSSSSFAPSSSVPARSRPPSSRPLSGLREFPDLSFCRSHHSGADRSRFFRIFCCACYSICSSSSLQYLLTLALLQLALLFFSFQIGEHAPSFVVIIINTISRC